MNILDKIIAHKRSELNRWVVERPMELLQEQARLRKPAPDFTSKLRSAPLGLIAEVKHMSPSAGIIRDPFEPAAIARAYEQAGAQAVSVLMDKKFFDGGEGDFQQVRMAVKLPLLYKEFVLDAWQLWHAASLGASAALLIAAALSDRRLTHLMGVARESGLTALVEVHDEEEVRRALDAGARCIGINNRNLKTFEVSLETTFRLRARLPSEVTVISESGISSNEQIRQLLAADVHGILVGEHFLRQRHLEAAVRELMSGR